VAVQTVAWIAHATGAAPEMSAESLLWKLPADSFLWTYCITLLQGGLIAATILLLAGLLWPLARRRTRV